MPRPADDLQAILTLGSLGALDDATLLDLFESPGAAAADHAFEVLVRRHGPLVLRVARGRLDSEEDARDAFQATFWLLARRSRSIRNRAALAGWLFGVASRVAARSVVESARRRTRERRVAISEADSTHDPARRDPDLAPTIQAEVARLPRLYRVAVILCDLEGLSYEEAATRLDCPLGTFKARLSRGRSRLRDRLARRGLAPAGWESTPSRPLVVPLALIQTTCRMVRPMGSALSSTVAANSAVLLARGVSRIMFLTKLQQCAILGLLATATGAVTYRGLVVAASPQPPSASAGAMDPPPRPQTSSPRPPASPPNLLQNAGFEEGTETPTAWSEGAKIDGVNYLWDRDKGNARQGNASLALHKTAQRFFPIAQWSQEVDRPKDAQALQVSAQVKAEGVTKAIIDVVFLNEKDEWIKHEWVASITPPKPTVPALTHDWKEYKGRVEIPPGTKKCQICLQIYGPGKVWFDEVRAEPVP